MHVDPQAALRRQLAELADGLGAVGHGALEMRDAAHHVDAAVERGDDPLVRLGRSQVAVLREGDELEVEIRRHLALDVEQHLDRHQARIADVDMAADRQQPAPDRPVAIGERALGDEVRGQ